MQNFPKISSPILLRKKMYIRKIFTLNADSMHKISFFKDTNILSDTEVIHQIRWWQSDAFELIYERYCKPLYNYIRTLLNFNTEEAGMVLSDVFIEAFKYIQTKDIDNLKGLLYRIAHNSSIDRIRKNEHQKEGLPEEAEHYEDHHDRQHKDKLDTGYKRKLMQEYLSKMDEKYRSVLYLVYYENKSYDEIAVIQNSNKNSIGTLAFQGKKKLEELMKHAGIDPNIFLL